MAERKLIDRLTDAVTQLRDPLPEKTLGDIELKGVEDRPDFGKGWSRSEPYRGWEQTFGFRDSGLIDYRRELGELDNSSLVMAVVNWTGINLAEALPVVTKPDEKGVPQIELQHEASDLIRRPNPFHIWADYCLAGAFSWWMGNWYMKKVRDNGGKLIELWYLPHYMVEPRWPGDGKTPEVPQDEVENEFLSHYQYTVPGNREPELIKQSDMVHIKRGVNLSNPRLGVGVWDGVIDDLYGHKAVNRFSATILKNMGMVQYLLSPKDQNVNLNPTEAARIKEQWIVNTTGDNANRPVVNAIPLEVTKLSFSPQELDLKELDQAPQSAIAGVTGIPAIVLQFIVGLKHGHYGAAYEQARQQGYENVIIPIQNHISEDLTWQVLPEIEDAKGSRITFDITKVRVLQEDRDNLYRRESEALRAGGITINQFLTSIGKEAIPDGDIYLVPAMSQPMTLERIKEIAEGVSAPPVVDPVVQEAAKFADIDRTIAYLEEQMKGFVVKE